MRKFLIAIICTSLFFFSTSCNPNYTILQKHEKHANEIEELLSSKYFSDKESGKQYAVADILGSSDPIFILLKKGDILNENSYFSYSSPNCISLVTRKSKNMLGGFSDLIITRNDNSGDFMCGITSLYTLNGDENATSLIIKCYNLAGHMTLAFVSTAY